MRNADILGEGEAGVPMGGWGGAIGEAVGGGVHGFALND